MAATEIDDLNKLVCRRQWRLQSRLCGVAGDLRSGSCPLQAADWLEARLGGQRYLVDDRVRKRTSTLYNPAFDAVYFGHFGNLRRIVDYPNLWAYARDCPTSGFGETVNFTHQAPLLHDARAVESDASRRRFPHYWEAPPGRS